jgi:hypothetical protein
MDQYNDVKNITDLSKDLAGTHTFDRTERDVDPALHAADWAALQADGYLMIENLFSDAECDAITEALLPLLDRKGRNAFEGKQTQRVYSTIQKTRACDGYVTHPRILALLDRMFMPNYLLSQLQVINILPGEEAQYLHPDDSFYPIPRPRAPLSAATIMALDDFTEANGATRLTPGSQHWGDRFPGEDDHTIPAEMPRGSVIFYGGTLWHGGGANTSDSRRLAMTAQYCEPWLRTQENFGMGIPKSVVRELSPQLQSLLGYSILPPYIGMVDGVHPKRLLEK